MVIFHNLNFLSEGTSAEELMSSMKDIAEKIRFWVTDDGKTFSEIFALNSNSSEQIRAFDVL